MGRYFEEFYRYDIPRNYLDSRKRTHTFDRDGRHSDACLKTDIDERLKDISEILLVDAAGIVSHIENGVAILRGVAPDRQSLDYIVSAVDHVDGVMRVHSDVQLVNKEH
jgi:osmotically-inducible protein OsmY